MPGKVKCIFFSLVVLLLLSSPAPAANIVGPDVRIHEDEIIVSTGLILDEERLMDIKNGISKEIIFYIDIFRVWKTWPDEFVLGKTVTKTLKCDPVKKEYIATSLSGTTLTEKRFNDCEPLVRWALSVKDFRVARTSELEPSQYFVKVTVESRLRRLPPIISSLFFFVREKEFSLGMDSSIFAITEK
jgi:hypothetical protein